MRRVVSMVVAWSAVVGCLEQARAGEAPLRPRPSDVFVNCGGTATDGALADQVWPWPEDSWGYVGKTGVISTTADIANNYGLPNAMKSARVWNGVQQYSRGNEFYYKFTLDNAVYRVKLYFAEIEKTAANQRRFDVYLNNDLALGDYDIYADAGGRDRGVEKVFAVGVTEQKLEIRFVKGTDRPMINALRITKTAEKPTPLATGTVVAVPGNHPRIHYVRWNKFAGTCSMEFVGTSIKWTGPRGSNMGKADVFVDGVFQTTVDQYSPAGQVDQVIFEKAGLTDNRHVFGILKAGEKNASAQGDLVTIQSLTYAHGSNSAPARAVYTDIRPHRPFWLDTDGDRIKAHLGNVQYFDGTYYWYGLDPGNTPLPAGTIGGSYPWSYNQGVAIYSSKDFYNWTYRGNVLQATTDKNSPLSVPSRIVGPNPVVIKNDATGRYVMYAELVDASFGYNNILVAEANHPAGPFRFLNADRGGNDMTTFKDDDGRAYHWVRGYIRELSDDYLHFKEGSGRQTGGGCEGGGAWKYDRFYYRSEQRLRLYGLGE
ncbi:MAG: malectin domain-containing carbohydrate-binding protein [Thermoguttaceae bacterium]